MFPNVRLMIAAILATVLALSFGFGVFAAFRVNHEPLNRLPSRTAPPQYVSIAAAQVPVALAIADTVGSRLESSDAPAAAVGAGLPMPPIDRPSQDEPPVAAAALQPVASTEVAPEPIAEPQTPTATSGADAPAPQTATIDAVVPAPQTQVSNADQDGKPDAMTDDTGGLPASAAPNSTKTDQPADQARPVPHQNVGQMVVRKRTVRRLTIATPRRALRARPPVPAEVSSQTYAVTQPYAAPQENFSFPSQTAPQAGQQGPQLGQRPALPKPPSLMRRAVVHKAAIKKAAAAEPSVRPSAQ